LDWWLRRRTRQHLHKLGETSIVTVFGAGPIAEAVAYARRAVADKGVLLSECFVAGRREGGTSVYPAQGWI